MVYCMAEQGVVNTQKLTTERSNLLMLTLLATEVHVVVFSIVLEKFNKSLGAFGGGARQVQVTG